jgi:hypothetical protein
MLGRRAAIGSSLVVLAVVGGGGAFAATHGSSQSSKPQVNKVVRPHVVAKPRATLDTNVRSGHHCNHEGMNASNL